MSFFNKYPYLDTHELNLDWLLNEMRALEKKLDDALQTLSAEIYAQVMKDIQNDLNLIRTDIDRLQSGVDELGVDLATLNNTFNAFTIYVDGKLDWMKAYVDAQATICNEFTNQRISQNNEYLLNTMSEQLRQVKVINFFSGELVGVQDMFDYLANLHATDSLDYDTMAARAKTYTQLAAFNKTYTDLVTSGNTWYV